jgi:PPOX class probable F420-dependent enzyme
MSTVITTMTDAHPSLPCSPASAPASLVAPFIRRMTALLTTFRRDGTPVGTPVNPVVEGDHIYFRTWNTTGKLKRIRNNPLVTLAPSTVSGRPTGSAIRARARILEGAGARHAARLLGGKFPIIHSWLIPLVHRLAGKKTVHLELTPIGLEGTATSP